MPFSFKNSLLSTLAAALLSIAVLPVAAQTAPSTGLGQSWPNSPNVSASPSWAVYRFQLHGVTYYQVNDLNGAVHMAVAVEGSNALPLPVGVDASRVVTSRARVPQLAAGTVPSQAQMVYHDAAVTILATPTAGTMSFSVAVAPCDDPVSCVGGR